MLKFSKVIAANSDLETSQAFVVSRSMALDDRPDYRADLYLTILVSGVGDNVFVKVRQLCSELTELFFDSNLGIPERLSEGINFLKTNLSDLEEPEFLLSAWRIPSEDSPEEHSANALFLLSSGAQKALLLRDNELVDLLETGGEGQLISGYLKSGDRLLFLNSILNRYLIKNSQMGGEKLLDMLRCPVDDLEAEVNSIVMQIPQPPPMAAVLVDYTNPSLNQPQQERPISNLENPRSQPTISTPQILKNAPLPKLRLPKNPRLKSIGITVAVVVLLLLAGLFYKKQADSKNDAQVNAHLASAEQFYSQAQSNQNSNPVAAKQALISAKNEVNAALKLKPNDSAAKNLQSEINQNSNTILKIASVSDWPLFLDLNLIKSGFSVERMALYNGELLLLDTNQKSLVQISLDNKTNQVLAGEEQLGTPQYASINGEFAYVYSQDKGVIRVDTDSLKTITAAKPDSDWGNIVDISGFAGNFYLLDSTKNQIWKYTPTDSGYTDKVAYLTSDTKANFSDAKRMLIDSSVWVLHSNNTLDRFTQGTPDFFSPSGLDQPLKSISAFFVSDETNNIYLIDSDNSRLVILQKNGQYVSQLVGDKFKDAQDLVVDEQNKKVYLLEDNKIYQISLP